jgi:chromate transporter
VGLVASSLGQIAAFLGGAVLGLLLCHAIPQPQRVEIAIMPSRTASVACLASYFLLLFALPLLASLFRNHAIAVASAFYRSGALVFGGGHVVLPLLRETVVNPGWISKSHFLAGYGAAQAMPGPLFTVSAYLGAALEQPPNGLQGALIALVAIFLPGMLILVGTLPFWHRLRSQSSAQAALRGVNASVVGILAAALYDPVWKSSVSDWRDGLLAAVGFVLLVVCKTPAWLVVVGFVAVSLGFH